MFLQQCLQEWYACEISRRVRRQVDIVERHILQLSTYGLVFTIVVCIAASYTLLSITVRVYTTNFPLV